MNLTESYYMKSLNEFALSLSLLSLFSACSDVGFQMSESSIQERLGKNFMVINADRPFTRDQAVKLSITADPDVQMYVTNSPGCTTGGEWQDYKQTLDWTLNGANSRQEVFVKFRTGNGTESDCLFDDIIHDNIAPSPSFSAVPSPYTNLTESPVAFSYEDDLSGVERTMCRFEDFDDLFDCTTGAVIAHAEEGSYTLYARSSDYAGNYSDWIETTWVVDRSSPKLGWVQKPPATTKALAEPYEVHYADNLAFSQLECFLNEVQLPDCPLNGQLNLQTEGSYVFRIQATDLAGNKSASLEARILVDRQSPQINLTQVPKRYSNHPNETILFEVKDNLEGPLVIECQLDGNDLDCQEGQADLVALSERSHLFHVRATDSVGNTSGWVSTQWTTDLTAPVLSWTQTPSDHYNETTSTFQFQVDEDGSGVDSLTCTINNTPIECSQGQYSAFNLPIGQNVSNVFASDKAGNTATIQHSWAIEDRFYPVQQIAVITEDDDNVDLLFVMDNSTSMSSEQRQIKQRIEHFVDKVVDLDYQIGVTTTDVSSSGQQGEILQLKRRQFVLTNQLTPDETQKLLGKGLQMQRRGNLREQGIYASLLAAEKSQSTRSPNSLLFRQNSKKAIILISDEDESGDRDYNQPETLIQYYKNLWPNSKMQFHSIVVLPGDRDCDDRHEHRVGHRYVKASQLTKGILGSVCEPDYAEQLAEIGRCVREQLTRVELECEPRKRIDQSEVEIKVTLATGDSTSDFTRDGQSLVFASPLPFGQNRLSYLCEKPDAATKNTAKP